MEVILTDNGVFHRSQFESEAALEKAILAIQAELFGKNRMYLDVKKKIGVKGGLTNIPDGYLLDLSGQKPRLYVVENELAAHDPLRHIAVQILQFSLSFEAEPRKVRNILFYTLQSQDDLRVRCEKYYKDKGYSPQDVALAIIGAGLANAIALLQIIGPFTLWNTIVGISILYAFAPAPTASRRLNRAYAVIWSISFLPTVGVVFNKIYRHEQRRAEL